MNITNVTVTKTAEEKTINGVYLLEFSSNNGILSRVQANIQEPKSDEQGIQQIIGTIYLDHGNVSCNLPDNRDLAPYFKDFDIFLKAISESILTKK